MPSLRLHTFTLRSRSLLRYDVVRSRLRYVYVPRFFVSFTFGFDFTDFLRSCCPVPAFTPPAGYTFTRYTIV